MLLPKVSLSFERINRPTSSQIYAPSKLPIVTSNALEESRFTHGRPSWNRRDLRACLIMRMSLSVIAVNCVAQSIDWSSRDNAAPLYNHALKHSNFDFRLHYESPPTHHDTSTRQNRQRNVIWFNPPYSKNVKTNIARDFLRLLDKHFPPSHKLYSIFNRHTVRISYSCTDNMKSFLDKHNKTILKKHTNRLNKDDEKLCNCRQRVNCPTDGKCLTRSVVYKAEVTSTDDNTTQTYIGVTANDFKTRYRNHLKSLRNEKYKHETELSKHVWNLKKENRQFSIRWAIVKQLPAGRNGKRNCTLCLEEKLMIMKGRSKNILNRRSEMFSKCRHVI